MVQIRKITKDDSENFLNLCMTLDHETKFMLREPGEREEDLNGQSQQIERVLQSGHSMIFVAEENRKLVGYLGAYGGQFRRIRHKVHIVIGIIKYFTCMGIGTSLFNEVEKWAKDAGIHRLELTVMSHNDTGIALYRKMGFSTEGVSKDSMYVDGKYVDEFYMGKLLQ